MRTFADCPLLFRAGQSLAMDRQPKLSMTGHTDALARRLVEQLEPVRPLAGPWRRAVVWFALAAVFIAVIALVRPLRADLATKLLEPRFVVEQTAALLTGVLAAVAAFATVTPGRSRRFVLLPLVPLAVWLGTLGHGMRDGVDPVWTRGISPSGPTGHAFPTSRSWGSSRPSPWSSCCAAAPPAIQS